MNRLNITTGNDLTLEQEHTWMIICLLHVDDDFTRNLEVVRYIATTASTGPKKAADQPIRTLYMFHQVRYEYTCIRVQCTGMCGDLSRIVDREPRVYNSYSSFV